MRPEARVFIAVCPSNCGSATTWLQSYPSSYHLSHLSQLPSRSHLVLLSPPLSRASSRQPLLQSAHLGCGVALCAVRHVEGLPTKVSYLAFQFSFVLAAALRTAKDAALASRLVVRCSKVFLLPPIPKCASYTAQPCTEVLWY